MPEPEIVCRNLGLTSDGDMDSEDEDSGRRDDERVNRRALQNIQGQRNMLPDEREAMLRMQQQAQQIKLEEIKLRKAEVELRILQQNSKNSPGYDLNTPTTKWNQWVHWRRRIWTSFGRGWGRWAATPRPKSPSVLRHRRKRLAGFCPGLCVAVGGRR